MNGAWGRKRKKNNGRGYRAALAGCLLAALLAGCEPPAVYDGTLARGQSRLTVVNQTPWQCGVSIERTDKAAGPRPTRLIATLGPEEQYIWDLAPGDYRLTATKLLPPLKGFTRHYSFRPDTYRIWPLVDLAGPGP